MTLTEDMKAIIQSAHLCFAATVTPDGAPNVSPKGTIRVWNDTALFFLDIASPKTRRNLIQDPRMELNVVDTLSRRGYRFAGRATVHESGETVERAKSLIYTQEGARYPVSSVIVLEVEYAAPLISPGYWHIADEHAMRASWRERRDVLDTEFETHLTAVGPFKVEDRE